MLSFMEANGYSSPTPHDSSGFSFPEAGTLVVTPTCYVEDDFGSAKRKGAMFTGDTTAALADIDTALTSAGYQKSEVYGSGIWWLGGEAPESARYAVGAGPMQVGDETVIWATWASH